MTGANEDRVTRLIVCRACGSPAVQCMDWVDANTNAVVGGAESNSDADTFCEACDEAGRYPHNGTTEREFPLTEALELLCMREGFDRDAVVEGAYPPAPKRGRKSRKGSR